MNRISHLNRQIFRCCLRPSLLVRASAVTWLVLLVAALGRGDWWPYTRAPAPFTLKIQETYYEQNPAGNLASVQTQAQRFDGTTVIVEKMYRTPVPRTLRSIKLPDGTSIRLVDALSAKSTCRPKHREVAPARETLYSAPRPPNCLGALDKLLGHTTLFGQPVNVVGTWDLGSGGERWVAPALGCKELQWQHATVQSDGSRRIDFEGKLVSFTLGEPDVRLFDLGASYAEIKPSELLRRQMEAAGVQWNPELAKEGVREDEGFAAVCQMPGPSQQ